VGGNLLLMLEMLNSHSCWKSNGMEEAEFVKWHGKDLLLFVSVELVLLSSYSWVRWKDQRHW